MVSIKQQLIQMGHDMGIDPYDIKVRGPLAWSKIHSACDILDTDCECHGECIELTSAIHDLVNYKLGKPIQYREIFLKVAARFQKVAKKIENCPGGICE